jgi:UTP--glucose-1-phosphate uridylyltransferase
MRTAGLEQAVRKMRDRGIDEQAIRVFEHYYRQIEDGATGTIPEDTIEPLTDIPTLGGYTANHEQRREALRATVVIKLNGGLGTSMGMTGPKSALPVRDDLTFLDITARQVLALRARFGVGLPLLLMNSFHTREDSLEVLARYPELAIEGLPLDFLQNAEPKLSADDLTPVDWPADPSLEWCPPGHGDVYVALVASGILQRLRDNGIRYAFLSNADNLGATCDPDIAAWMLENEAPYVAEVCERTLSDRKGGHLAVRKADGRLILRDIAMVVDGEEHMFQDIARHRTFNTNNLWVDLEVLERLLSERDGVLGLPIIVNRKTVDPADGDSPEVIQIESAMGTAIETFAGSRAMQVPRTRFRPVKTTNELLLIRSDVFALDDAARIMSMIDHPEPKIDLADVYKLVADFDARFPSGPPSLRECTSLTIRGDVTFGADVSCVGDVTIIADAPRTIENGARLTGEV